MPNNALTSTANPTDVYKLFDITVRAGLLDETLSNFLTKKERTAFEPGDVVSVHAGTMDAIVYILLHEATHVVDGAMQLTLNADSPFTKDIWTTRTTLASKYSSALLDSSVFRAGGRVYKADDAPSVYQALSVMPFVSLYGSSNWHDDLAELVAWHHLNTVLEQPYSITARRKDGAVYTWAPMESALVQSRFRQLSIFYDAP